MANVINKDFTELLPASTSIIELLNFARVPALTLVQWFAAHLEHWCKKKRQNWPSKEQITTPQVLYKPWCGLYKYIGTLNDFI